MHPLAELLNPQNTACRTAATSRKRVLQNVADLICAEHEGHFTQDELFEGLMNRERLGSTGLGDGVAIPHCRLACEQICVALITLPEPIDYEAGDGQGVDILFVLVVPVDEKQAHLDALAALAELFALEENRQALRACTDSADLMQLMQDLLNRQVAHSKTA
ncbi:MAG: PTS sugar transporter subunit IIA [Pseudomonadota bacterium]